MKTNDMNKKILLTTFVFLLPIFPFVSNAALIPDCDTNCGYNDLIKLVNNIINWIIMISFPVAAGVFAWAGIKYMTTGVSDQKSEAKNMIRKTLIGFVFILSAWIIVSTILNALLSPTFPKESIPVEVGP